MHAIAITGVGVVTPCGSDVAALWRNLCAGRSGVDHIRGFDAANQTVRIAGEVKDFDPANFGLDVREARRLDRFAQFGLAAAGEALEASGLLDEDRRIGGVASERCGVVVGTGMGGAGVDRAGSGTISGEGTTLSRCHACARGGARR